MQGETDGKVWSVTRSPRHDSPTNTEVCCTRKDWHDTRKASEFNCGSWEFFMSEVEMFHTLCWQNRRHLDWSLFIFACQNHLFCEMQTSSKLNSQSAVGRKQDSWMGKFGDSDLYCFYSWFSVTDGTLLSLHIIFNAFLSLNTQEVC